MLRLIQRYKHFKWLCEKVINKYIYIIFKRNYLNGSKGKYVFTRDCLLGGRGTSLHLIRDKVIFDYIQKNGAYEEVEVKRVFGMINSFECPPRTNFHNPTGGGGI